MIKESMTMSKGLFHLFTIATSILFGAGYWIAGFWYVNILILFLFASHSFAHKFNWRWVFSVVLLSNTLLATFGMVMGAPTFLMIAGVATALGSWELSNTGKKFKKIYTHPLSYECEKNRARLLVISLGSGLIVAEIAQFIKIQLSFIVIFFITIIILFCFYQVHRLLSHSNQ